MLIERARTLALWALAGAFASAPFSNSFFEIFSSVYLVLGVFLLVSDKRWEVFRNLLGILALVYLCVNLISTLQSAHPASSWKGLFRILRCVLMCFLAPVVCDGEKKFRFVYWIVLGVAFTIGLDALVQAATGTDLLRGRGLIGYIEGTGRVTGPFHHATDFSAYLCLTLFLYLGMLRYALVGKKIKEGAIFLIGTGLLGLCLLWTYTRGAWLAVAAAWLVMAIFKRDKITLTVLVIGAGLVLLFSPEAVRGRFASLQRLNDGTLSERQILWKESLDMAAERPWLGHGPNTYAQVEPLFKDESTKTDYQYAHNGYLQIAAESGYLGLASFLAFLVCFFVLTLKGLVKDDGFAASACGAILFGVFAFLLHSFTDTDLQSLRLVGSLWLCMGLALAGKKTMGLWPR